MKIITPFFSIVIPTLNEENFLPRLLACLAKQTYKDFEVIVCDGNSGDKTVEKAFQFINKLPQLLVLSNLKRNVSYQRNLGARQAKGVYLQFMDADVVIKKGYLNNLQKNLQKKDIPVATTWMMPDSKHPADEAMIFLTNIVIETSRYLDIPFAPGYNIVVKRSLFAKIGGFGEHIRHAEDHHFVQQAAGKGYLMSVFKEPKLTVSLRRLRREGRLTVARKYAKAILYILFKGPITRDIFDYPMGGHLYDKNPQKKTIIDYLHTLSKNGEETANRVLKDTFEI